MNLINELLNVVYGAPTAAIARRLVRGVPIFNANGEIQKWFGTCTDIEDLKQGEQALQENAKRLRSGLGSPPDGQPGTSISGLTP